MIWEGVGVERPKTVSLKGIKAGAWDFEWAGEKGTGWTRECA